MAVRHAGDNVTSCPVGAASAAIRVRESARCRGIAGIAGSHRELWVFVVLARLGEVFSPPWRILQFGYQAAAASVRT
ncbi:hypothetical protein FHS47_003108 [Lutibacter sp. SG786]|nr:hypothetical protein [Luteibacter sp. SG786]